MVPLHPRRTPTFHPRRPGTPHLRDLAGFRLGGLRPRSEEHAGPVSDGYCRTRCCVRRARDLLLVAPPSRETPTTHPRRPDVPLRPCQCVRFCSDGLRPRFCRLAGPGGCCRTCAPCARRARVSARPGLMAGRPAGELWLRRAPHTAENLPSLLDPLTRDRPVPSMGRHAGTYDARYWSHNMVVILGR